MTSDQIDQLIADTGTALAKLLNNHGWTDVKVTIDVDAKRESLSTHGGSRLRDLFD